MTTIYANSGNLLPFFWGGRIKTRWWFQTFFIFTPTWGRFPIWQFFSDGLKPPNRKFLKKSKNLLREGEKSMVLADHGFSQIPLTAVAVVKVARAKKEIWTCYGKHINRHIVWISRLASADSSLYYKTTAWVCNWCGFQPLRCQVLVHHLIATLGCSLFCIQLACKGSWETPWKCEVHQCWWELPLPALATAFGML